MPKDRWPDLLDLVRLDDGLPVRECGSWTQRKLWFWNRYVEITTSAMVGRPQWAGGLVYVDMFAGPGVCRIRDTDTRLPGSPLIAANAPKPFTKIIAVELIPYLAEACRTRLDRFVGRDQSVVLTGDCHAILDTVISEIPERSLVLAFIDPEGFDIKFEMLRRLSENRRVDFLILFADAIDLVRNIDAYEKDPESKLYSMLGDQADWKPQWEALTDRSGPRVREFFASMFANLLKSRLGYQGVRQEVIEGDRGPLYRLIYASKSDRGTEFWDKIAKRELGGQRRLW